MSKKINYPEKRYTGESPWMNRDWLYNEYVVKDRSTKDIAEEYGCCRNTIQQWLSKHKIKKDIVRRERKIRHRYETYDYLYKEHIINNRSVVELARDNDVSDDTIRYHLVKNGIEIQKQNIHKVKTDEDIREIKRLYCDEKKSANEIAKMFDTSHSVIINTLRREGVATRDYSEAQFAYNNVDVSDEYYDPEILRKMHWDDGMSCKDIGEYFGVDPGTVRRHMNNIGVQTKNNAESKIGMMIGPNHPNWKGGITELHQLLREYFSANLAPKIANRDEYTCQLCGKQHTVLHIHHIVPFSKIVREICLENPDLDVSDNDDKYKLYDIITHDERFLDENNLITFCKECHFYLIHEFTNKTISSQA